MRSIALRFLVIGLVVSSIFGVSHAVAASAARPASDQEASPSAASAIVEECSIESMEDVPELHIEPAPQEAGSLLTPTMLTPTSTGCFSFCFEARRACSNSCWSGSGEAAFSCGPDGAGGCTYTCICL